MYAILNTLNSDYRVSLKSAFKGGEVGHNYTLAK